MNEHVTVYDPGNGHRLRLIERRRDGNNLYEDIDNGDRVISHPHDAHLFTSRVLRKD